MPTRTTITPIKFKKLDNAVKEEHFSVALTNSD